MFKQTIGILLLTVMAVGGAWNATATAEGNDGDDLRKQVFKDQDAVEIDPESDVEVLVLDNSWPKRESWSVIPHLPYLKRLEIRREKLDAYDDFLTEIHFLHSHIDIRVNDNAWEPQIDFTEEDYSYGLNDEGRQALKYSEAGRSPYVYQLRTLRYVKGDETLGYYQRFEERSDSEANTSVVVSLSLPDLPDGATHVEMTVEEYIVPYDSFAYHSDESTKTRSRKYTNMWHLFTTYRPVDHAPRFEIWSEVRGDLGKVLDDLSIPNHRIAHRKEMLSIPDECR